MANHTTQSNSVNWSSFFTTVLGRIVTWALFLVISLYVAVKVTDSRVQALETWRQTYGDTQITRPEFMQFKEDLSKRLDTIDKGIDKLDTKLDTKADKKN